MNKSIYFNTLKYTFNADHKGAPFTIDGDHFMNAGEFAEVALKACKGYEPIKDKNTKFNEVSDIEQTKTSVKSSGATLTSVKLGADFDIVLKKFFEMSASTNYSYVTIIEDIVTEYNMNANEFKEFVENWASYQNDRQVIRFKKTSGKMING